MAQVTIHYDKKVPYLTHHIYEEVSLTDLLLEFIGVETRPREARRSRIRPSKLPPRLMGPRVT